MHGDDEIRGLELLEKARKLSRQYREVVNYFLENISVGSIRSIKELKATGIENPEKVIEELVQEGIIEEGVDCYNLAKPLRELVFKRGKIRI